MKSTAVPFRAVAGRRRLPHWRLNLLGKFSLVSFLLIAALGVALAWLIQVQLEQSALQQEAENAGEQITVLLRPSLWVANFQGPLPAATIAKLDDVVKQSILGTHTVRVKIWSRTGVVLYSDQKDLIGQRFPIEDDLEGALDGKVVANVSSLDSADNVDERGRFRRLLEIYTPLRPIDSQAVAGAYEVYHDLDVVQPHIDEMRGYVWGSLGLGFLILYAALFTLVRGASADLTRHSAQNAQLYQQATQRLAERQVAEAQVQRQVQRLAALRTIDLAITAGHDLRITLDVFLERVIEQLGVDAAAVLLLSPQMPTLDYAAGRGFRTSTITRYQVRLGEGYAGLAALERRTVSAASGERAPSERHARLLADEGFVCHYAVPLLAKGQVKGVLEIFQRTALDPEAEWLGFLEALAGQAAIAVDNAMLFEDLQRSNQDLALAYDTTLEGWSRTLELRDQETQGHTLRVTEVALTLARAVGMSEADLVQVRRGALLHDMGKMGIPDDILLKPGPLTDDEMAIMRRHPVYAYELLSPILFLRPALDIPYCHHEKWDGTGYPRGLKGEQIPLAARVFAVIDVWDALRSDRPYRRAWPEDQVRRHIQSLAGTHFEPRLVDAFLALDL